VPNKGGILGIKADSENLFQSGDVLFDQNATTPLLPHAFLAKLHDNAFVHFYANQRLECNTIPH
jgi:hypothetical protein